VISKLPAASNGVAPVPALQGITVLSLECFIAGPTASMWMADMGAEVIKIEQPGVGEPARSVPPMKHSGEKRSLGLLRANRNKKSLTLDLKSKRGCALFEQLLAKADVLLDNLRPDALEKMGFTWERMQSINPRLIYTSISGFGRNDMSQGPYQDWPAFDIVGQAMAGLMQRPERTTTNPAYLGFPLADIQVGIVAVTGTLQALFQRTRTGVGQRVDVAMYDTALVMNELAMILNTSMGIVPAPGLHALSYPFGSYRARDGFIVIAVLGEKIWGRFCAAIGRPELGPDPRLLSGIDRNKQAHWLNPIIDEWLATRDRKEAVAHLIANGVPAAPVQDVDDIANCPQVAARDMLMEIEDPAWGKVRIMGQPIKTSGSPPPRKDAPPTLGQHTDQLLLDLLGMSATEVDQLRAAGIV
jgi:CoA:oxalate CoA-transferase